MSNITFIVSIPDNPSANISFYEDFLKSCEERNIPVRYELYESDIYHDLNLKALELERNQTLTELEEEILNNVSCVGGNCED